MFSPENPPTNRILPFNRRVAVWRARGTGRVIPGAIVLLDLGCDDDIALPIGLLYIREETTVTNKLQTMRENRLFMGNLQNIDMTSFSVNLLPVAIVDSPGFSIISRTVDFPSCKIALLQN